MSSMFYNFPDLKSLTRKRKVFGDEEEEAPLFGGDIDFSKSKTITAKPKPQQNQRGTFGLANVLQAIAAGFGVGLSDDPGAALVQQLARQQQQQMQAAEIAAQERRAELEAQNRRELEEMRINAQQSITGAEIKATKERDTAKLAGEKELANLGFANQTKRDEAQLASQEKLALLEQRLKLEVLDKTQEGQRLLEDIKNTGDINQALAKTTMASLLHANINTRYMKGARIPANIIASITHKISKGEINKLTKEETDAVDNAFKTQEAAGIAAARSGGGGRSGGVNTKTAQSNLLDREKNKRDLINAAILQVTKPMVSEFGQVIPGKTGAELGKLVQEIVDVYDTVDPIPQIQTNQNAQPTIQPQDAVQAQVNAQIDANWGTLTPQALTKIVDDDVRINPAQKRQAKAYINQKAQSNTRVRLKDINPFGK